MRQIPALCVSRPHQAMGVFQVGPLPAEEDSPRIHSLSNDISVRRE